MTPEYAATPPDADEFEGTGFAIRHDVDHKDGDVFVVEFAFSGEIAFDTLAEATEAVREYEAMLAEHDASIRADERAKVLAERDRLPPALREDVSLSLAARCLAYASRIRELEALLAREREAGRRLAQGETAHVAARAGLSKTTGDGKEWPRGHSRFIDVDHEDAEEERCDAWTFVRLHTDAARAHGAREALESAANEDAERLAREVFNGFNCSSSYDEEQAVTVERLRARAAAIDPTTHADTLRAEAAASALEDLAEFLMREQNRITTAHGLSWSSGEAKRRAAELRAKGAR